MYRYVCFNGVLLGINSIFYVLMVFVCLFDLVRIEYKKCDICKEFLMLFIF